MASRVSSKVREALAPGALFAGKYRIVGPVGSGNFAVVLRARQDGTERDVALKVLKPELVDSNPEVAQRFATEVKVISRLHHPNTVTLHDFGRTPEGLYFMVLEYLDGESVEDILAREGAMPPQRVLRIIQQTLKSLDEAHNLGIVHRDLKPSNIMLVDRSGEDDVVKILDFGVAKLMGDGEEDEHPRIVRRSTQFIGTPIYMSPEQVLGQKVRPSSDIYSLGLILYQMLTGDSPIDSNLNVSAVAQMHIDDKPLPFAKLANLPRAFAKLIRKATSRHPEDRYQTVREFARDMPREADMDYTGEFRQLIGASESEDSVPLVFQGRTYVAPPDEEEHVPEILSQSRELPIVQEIKPKREVRSFNGKEDLRVDVAKVRREEFTRKRTKSQPSGKSSGVRWTDYLLILPGVLAFFATWHFAGVLVPGTPVVKAGLGLLPTLLALLWAHFSEVRSVHGSWFEKWVVPSVHYHLKVTGLLAVAALLMPRFTLNALEVHRSWPVELVAQMETILGITGLWLKPLEFLMKLTATFIPW